MGYDGVDDGIGIGRVLKDVKMGNNGVGDSAKNQENWHATVKNIKNSDDRVIVVVDVTDGVLINILAYFFGLLLPQFNLLPNVTAACSG